MKKHSAYIFPQTIHPKAKSSVECRHWPQTRIRFSLLKRYLAACLRQAVIPWRFFQLNARYFNRARGIYSKLDMDGQIPSRWRLRQHLIIEDFEPETYPVFLKPEWGQNAKGIRRVDTKEEFVAWRNDKRQGRLRYIAQEAAAGDHEYEVYYLRTPQDPENYAFLSLTEVVNDGLERYPVNSIHNQHTRYREVTEKLAESDRRCLWRLISSIGCFRMARVAVKAFGMHDLLTGNFKVVEINIFLPMPLVLLAENVGVDEKRKIVHKTMEAAAALAKTVSPQERARWIFFRKLLAHYRVRT